jgi:hypothetical protein
MPSPLITGLLGGALSGTATSLVVLHYIGKIHHETFWLFYDQGRKKFAHIEK